MDGKPRELNSFPLKLFPNMMEIFSSLSANPLFSSIITLYTLLLLYFPTNFLGIIFSPVLISTFILLLSLLRLGATQEENENEKDKELNSAEIVAEELNSTDIVPEEMNSAEIVSTQPPSQQIHEFVNKDHKWVACQVDEDFKTGPGSDLGPGPDTFHGDSFLEWDVRAPLEVIYEAYEGEEEGNGDVLEENRETQMAIMERYASLSMYYPETDTDASSSEGDYPTIGELDSPENLGFRWDEEDGEGLIEIALDGKRKSEVEEENLIEIDFLRRVSRRDDVFSRGKNDGFSDEV